MTTGVGGDYFVTPMVVIISLMILTEQASRENKCILIFLLLSIYRCMYVLT